MNLRAVGLVVLGLAVFAGLIYGAIQLESSGFGSVRSDKNKRELTVKLEPRQQEDLIIYCNEGYYHAPFEAFRRFIKVEPQALSVPGGPMAIAYGDLELPDELQPPQRVAIEVLKRHAPRRVVLLSHEECLLYDSIGAWFDDPASVRERQYADLFRAREVLGRWFPQATVEIFYGEKVGDLKMHFFPVPDDSLHRAVVRHPAPAGL